MAMVRASCATFTETLAIFGIERGPYVLTQCRGSPEASERMAGSDKRKQSLYFPEDMLKEIQDEANRQDRSLSWIVQKAWKIARKEIMKYPSVNEFPGEEDEKEIA
jgi:uncharacterized small protein (TIGR04563 family)